jgi:hypothetical protein
MSELILPYLPGNLESLRKREEENRTASILFINSTPKDKDVIELVHVSLNIIYEFTKTLENRTDDELTIQFLGLRLFNSIASSLLLLLSGYYQCSIMILRDVLETGSLLDYFTVDNSEILIWKNSGPNERRRNYKPSVIRKALDKRDGFTVNYREQLYSKMSEYATHPTHPGTKLISPKGLGKIGPFIEGEYLKHMIEEFALRIPYFTLIYLSFFNSLPTRFVDIKNDYLLRVKNWSLMYVGHDLSIINSEQRKVWIMLCFEPKDKIDKIMTNLNFNSQAISGSN